MSDNKKQWEFLDNINNMVTNSRYYLELKNLVSNIPINTEYLEQKGLTEETIQRYEEDQPTGISLNLYNIITLISSLAHQGLIMCDELDAYHDDDNYPCCLCGNKILIPLEKYLQKEFEKNIPPF